jgi:hypothetical protein
MASRDWHSTARSEILLMAAGGGLLAWCSPKFDLLAIVAVVALGRFRGRIQALIAASTLSAIGIAAAAAGHPIPHRFMGAVQLGASICAIWLCAFMADSFWVYHLHHANGRA